MAGRQQNGASRAEVRERLDTLEDDLERLRVTYEKYFCGIERIAPSRQHSRVDAQIRQLMAIGPTQTAVRFRFNGLRARLVTYQHYWNRILAQIERGTFKRDLDRAKRRQAQAVPAAPTEAGAEAGAEAAAAPTAAPHGRASGGSGKPPALPPGLEAKAVRVLFKELVAAKRAAGERTDGLTYGALVRKLAREAPRLQRLHKCDTIHFEVATEDGKVRLRARSNQG